MKNLNKLLNLLLQNNIDFVLIGGFAGTLYGSSYVTQDLDICMSCSPEQVEKLRILLKDYHPVHRMTPQKISFLTNPESLKNIKNLYINSDLGTLDVLSEVISIGDYERVKSNAVTVQIMGHLCKIIALDDLIQCKKALGRDKDKIALKELEFIRKNKK